MSASLARQRETQLLILAGVFLLVAAAALSLAPAVRAGQWPDLSALPRTPLSMMAAWLACAGAASVVTRRALPRHDPLILPIVYLLSGWGLLLIWRLAPGFGVRQTLWLGVGTAALLGVVLLPGDLRWLRRYRYTWLVAGLALTALTLFLGVNPSGAGERLWLGCCGLYLQPAELLKLLVVVFLASYLSDRREQLFTTQPGEGAAPVVSRSLAYFLPMLAMWGFSALILVSQRDLGMSTLFFGVFIIMLYLASGRVVYVLAGGLLLALAAVLGYYLFDVVRLRVEAWWNPWADPTGRSYQIVQSLIAVGAGDLTGRGPGLGAPGVIPVAHSDFIFAALAEEWGLLGVGAVAALLALLVGRGLRVALEAPTLFGQLLAGGLAGLLGLQALLIMGGVIKLTPLTGLTLPFMSYGGSSLLSAFVLVGLLLNDQPGTAPLAPSRRWAGTKRSVRGPMVTQTRRLSAAFALAFALVVLAAGYWSFVRGEALLARADNPRRVLDERRTARGKIEDRHEAILAESLGEPGALTRHYPYPALAPVLGYVSPLYGLAGVEAALDAILHGGEGVDAFDLFWQGTVLGEPPPGRDVRLTLDLDLQRTADEALGQRAGTVVVLDIRTGHLLAVSSHPAYDANALEDEWEGLVADPDAPLLNRATLGLYQPGGALWPVTLAAAAYANPGLLTQSYDQAQTPITINEHTFACRQSPRIDRLTLRESLIFGCPAPLATVGDAVGEAVLADTFEAFELFAPPALALPTNAAEPPVVWNPRLDAIGQGAWAVTPLRLALALAAITGDGTLPAPQIVLATQGANGIWRPAEPEGHSVRVMTAEAAALVKALLPQSYVAEAQSGAEGDHLAWYLGYTPRDDTRHVIVVLLEDGDTAAARAIGDRMTLAVLASQ